VCSVLLAILSVSAIACPAAWASPEGESNQHYGQPPPWGSCERWVGDVTRIPTAQCGTVSVPVDYAKPEGAQAQLAVIRIPASGDRIGVLVVNPGGPGASAVDTVASMGASLADTDVMRRFDLVGIDPRGGGLRVCYFGGQRPAGGRASPAGFALPPRRRVRRVPSGADDRLQPRRR